MMTEAKDTHTYIRDYFVEKDLF